MDKGLFRHKGDCSALLNVCYELYKFYQTQDNAHLQGVIPYI